MRNRGVRPGLAVVLLVFVVSACSSGSPTPAAPTLPPFSGAPQGSPLLVLTPEPAATSTPAPAQPSTGPVVSASPVPQAPTASPPASPPAVTPAPTATPGPTLPPASVPSLPPSAAPSPTPPGGTGGTCTPEAPTGTSKDWQTLASRSGAFSFAIPADWADDYGEATQKASEVLDKATLAETGISGDATMKPDIVDPPATGIQNPNLRVFVFAGVTSTVATVNERLKTFYTNSDNQLLNTAALACIGGEPASGLELLFSKGASFFRLLLVEHSGSLYVIEWIASAADAGPDTLAEILRTWTWTGAANPSAPVNPSAATFPDPDEQAILVHVPAALAGNCSRSDAPTPSAIAAVVCSEPGKPRVTYNGYADTDTLNSDYQRFVKAHGSPTDSAKGCAGGDYEAVYSNGGKPAGRLMCTRDPGGGGHLLIWITTADRLMMTMESSTLSWADLYTYWTTGPGPLI